MLRPSRPRPLLAAAVVVLLVAAGAGCSSTLEDAATVDGESISRSDFEDELEEMLGNDAFVEALRQNEFEVSETGSAASTVDTRLSSLWLDTLIDQVVIDAEFDARGLRVDDSHRAQARTRMEAFFTTVQSDPAAPPIVVFDQFDEDFQSRLIERNARAVALAADEVGDPGPPSEQDARDFYDEQVERALEQCPLDKQVWHILVETEAEADAALARLGDGEEFGTVAAELSTDTGSASQGGALGCLVEGQFVEAFESAAVGAPLDEPVGPVESDFGWHVILVRPLVPPYEDVREQVLAQLEQQAADQAGQAMDQVLSEIVVERLRDAEVTVNPRYGRWVVDENGPRVEPPAPPEVREGREPTTTTIPGLLEPDAPTGG